MSIAPKPYSEMTSAAQAGLEPIPAHWELARFKRLLQERDSRSFDGREQLLRVSQYTGVTQRQTAGGSQKPDTRAESLIGYKRVERNDLVVNIMLAWNGSMGVSSFRGIVSPAYCVYRFKSSAHPRYFHYLLRSVPYKTRIKAESTGVVESRLRLYTDDLFRLEAHLPPPSEQTAIARFLDHMDRRIQKYIRAKEKLIVLLDEYKQVLIHQAVTGKIDVRTGEPYPEYKESGVEWLGKVPGHWEATLLGRVLMQRKEKNDPIKTTDILSLSLKTGVIPYAEKESGGNKAKEDLSAYMLAYPGDIVVNSMNVVVGSVGLSKYFGAVSPVYYMLRPRHKRDLVKYFDGIFQCVRFQRSLFGIGNGIMFIESRSSGKLNTIRLRIPMSKLKRVILPWPPADEQGFIVKHLDGISANVTSTIAHARREIDLLTEYRIRLIADVVTGKLDVQKAAAALPDIDSLESEKTSNTA